MKTIRRSVTLVALVLAGTGLARAAATLLYQFDGGTQGETAGFAVASGDVNGDGHRDVIVGAPVLGSALTTSADGVLVYDGATGALLTRLDPGPGITGFGRSVAAADVDGDGRDDVIVGAPFQAVDGQSDVGMVHLYALHGTIWATLPPFPGVVAPSGPQDRWGWSVAGCDLDSDGHADVIMGSQRWPHVVIYSGSTGAPLGTRGDGDLSSGFGAAIACGDLDRQGPPEIVVGAPGWNDGTGRVYVFSAGQEEDALWVLEGPQPGGRFGQSVACGDVTGDGYDDIVVGAPYGEAGSATNPGSAFIYSYQGRSLVRQHDGQAVGERFGRAVACLNADGNLNADVLVGAPAASGRGGESEAGRAYVFSGGTGQALFRLDGVGSAAGQDHFGTAVTGGDVNRDGYDEVIVGEPNRAANAVPESGRVYVYALTRGGRVYVDRELRIPFWELIQTLREGPRGRAGADVEAAAAGGEESGTPPPSPGEPAARAAGQRVRVAWTASGGNPGAFQRIQHNSSSGTVTSAHLRVGAVYHPATEGAIKQIDLSFDLIHFTLSKGYGVGFRLLLSQNGSYYAGPTILAYENQWRRFARTGLAAADFPKLAGRGPSLPDFSASGKRIQFGFLSNSAAARRRAVRTAGIDNWVVAINPPAPDDTGQ